MKRAVLLPAALALAACGGPERQEAEEAESAFEPMTEQLEKAKAVEGAAAERKREIDDALREVDEPPDR